nr:hypothetical protein [uncultured Romboutsia sp.]
MEKEKYKLIEEEWERVKMAIMAKNKANSFAIKSSNAKEFIKEMKKNKITESFLEECKIASKLFKRK